MAFINVRESDRGKIHDIAKSYNEQNQQKKQREIEIMTKYLYMDGNNIDHEAYGFKMGADRFRILGVMRAWYMYNGMSAEEILSEDPEVIERRTQLMQEFNYTFARQPDDTDESLRDRRLWYLSNMQDMIGRMKPVIPETNSEITAESFQSYMDLANLQSDMAINITDEYYNGAYRNNYAQYSGTADSKTLHDENLYGGVHSSYRTVASSLCDIFATSAFEHNLPLSEASAYFDSHESMPKNRVETRDPETQRVISADLGDTTVNLRKSLQRLHNFEQLSHEYNIDQLRNTSVRDMTTEAKGALATSLIVSAQDPNSYDSYNDIFINDYVPGENRRDIPVKDPNTVGYFFMHYNRNERLLSEVLGVDESELSTDDALQNIYINGRSLYEHLSEYDSDFMERYEAMLEERAETEREIDTLTEDEDFQRVYEEGLEYRNFMHSLRSRAADVIKYSLSAESPNVVTVKSPDASNPIKMNFRPVYPPFAAYAEPNGISAEEAQTAYDAKIEMITRETEALNNVYENVREPITDNDVDFSDRQKNMDFLLNLTGIRPAYSADPAVFKSSLHPLLGMISINGRSLADIMDEYELGTSDQFLEYCAREAKLGLDEYGIEVNNGLEKEMIFSDKANTEAIYHDRLIDASKTANTSEAKARLIDSFNQKEGKIILDTEGDKSEDELLDELLRSTYESAYDDDEYTADGLMALLASESIYVNGEDMNSELYLMHQEIVSQFENDDEADLSPVYNRAIQIMKTGLHSGRLLVVIDGKLVPVLPKANENNIDQVMDMANNATRIADRRNKAFEGFSGNDKVERTLILPNNEFHEIENKYNKEKYNAYLESRAEVKHAREFMEKNKDSYLRIADASELPPRHYISQLTGRAVPEDMEISDAVALLNNIRINGKAVFQNVDDIMDRIAAEYNIGVPAGSKTADVLAERDADFKKNVVDALMRNVCERVDRAVKINSIDTVEVTYTDSAAHKRGTKKVIPQNSDVFKDPDAANTFLRKQEEVYNIRNSRNVRVIDHKPNGRALSDGELIEQLLGERINPKELGEQGYRPDFDFDALDPALRSQLLGKIYINGRNIRACLGEDVPFNTQNVCAKIREALSSENGDFITVMKENSLEPAPVAIVTEEALKASLNFAHDNDFESNSLARSKVDKSVSYVKNFRNEIYNAVKQVRSGSYNPKSIGATADMIYADFYTNIVKDYTATNNIKEYQDTVNSYAMNTVLQGTVQAPGGRPGSDASLIALYMMSKGYTFEQVIDQSAEMKRVRADIGKEYYDIFSLPQIDGKNLDINSPEASRKFEQQAMPTLMKMAEAYSHIQLPYVDFSDPESIKRDGFKVQFITQMGMDFAQANNPRIHDLISKTTPRLMRNIVEERMKYVYDLKSDGTEEESRYLSGLPNVNSRTLNAIKAQGAIDALGNDLLREIGNAEIGALGYNCFSEMDNQLHERQWLTENELRTGIMSDVLKGDFSKVSDKFSSLNKMDERVQALKENVGNAVNTNSDIVFETKLNDFMNQPITDTSISIKYNDLGNNSPISVVSNLTTVPLTENDTELNRRAISKAFDLLYINGVSAKLAYGLDENSTFADYMNASKEIKDTLEDTFIKGTGNTFVMVKNTEENKLLAVKVPAVSLSMPEKTEKWGFWERRRHSSEEVAENEAAVKRYEEYVALKERLNKKTKDATDYTRMINRGLAEQQRAAQQAQNNAPAQDAPQAQNNAPAPNNTQNVRVLNLDQATNMRNGGNANSNENANSQQMTQFQTRGPEAQQEAESSMNK